jgi:hypothetical protein
VIQVQLAHCVPRLEIDKLQVRARAVCEHGAGLLGHGYRESQRFEGCDYDTAGDITLAAGTGHSYPDGLLRLLHAHGRPLRQSSNPALQGHG